VSAGDTFRSVAAEAYDRHVGRYSPALARELIATAGVRPSERALDVGCGPGALTGELVALLGADAVAAVDPSEPFAAACAARNPGADVRVASGEALPFADGAFDLVHSNLCLQWCDDPGLALAEFGRVLRPGGLLLFTTFGPATLHELRSAFSEADATPHVSRFIDMHDIGDALLSSGFRDPVLERDDFTLTYADARELMHELRAIGATNADAQRQRSLTGKAHLAGVIAAYERFRYAGVLPATYEVIYAIARAPEPGQPVRGHGGDVASFPIEQLRGSRRR